MPSGWRQRIPDCDGAGTAERSYPEYEVGGGGLPRGDTHCLRSGAAAWRSYPTPPHPRPGAAAGRSNRRTETRGGGQENQPHVQGAMAAQVQEGLEELSHILLLVYRNAKDFYVLVLYTATLPNPLMSPNSFPVASLEFSRYSIMSTANSDSFTSLLIWILFFFFFFF